MNNILSSVVFISFLMIHNAFSNAHMNEHREFSPRLMPKKLGFNNDDKPTDNKDYYDDTDSSIEYIEALEPKDIDEMKVKYNMLLKMLEDPKENQVPIIYFDPENEPDLLESSAAVNEKRSGRYHQKFPSSWKRQHTTRYRKSRAQNNYKANQNNICVPTREDVMNLLSNLHESRSGSERTIQFCNRSRPATSIFTNIRFLG